jgi:uncharacterized membrane protein YfcA
VLLLDLLLGFGIGTLIGMLGGGGSILTVPALVYLVGQTPQAAITTSLAIVGANSVMGAYFHRARGTLNGRVALVFGGAGMVVAYWAAGLSRQIAPSLLMVAFAVLLVIIGIVLIARKTPEAPPQDADLAIWKVVASGAVVGLLTGILGVGGGFLIVPALVMLVGLPIHKAVGTSLLIIAMNSLAGFLGHLGETALPLDLIALFVLGGLAGTFAGVRLGQLINAHLLRRVFAVFIIGLALVLLADHLPKALG